jgi:hypothetical protein
MSAITSYSASPSAGIGAWVSESLTSGLLRARDAMETGLTASRDRGVAFRWIWVVLIGVLVIAAAVAWVVCLNRGHRGFSGAIEAVRGPFGIKIGIKLGCY